MLPFRQTTLCYVGALCTKILIPRSPEQLESRLSLLEDLLVEIYIDVSLESELFVICGKWMAQCCSSSMSCHCS